MNHTVTKDMMNKLIGFFKLTEKEKHSSDFAIKSQIRFMNLPRIF